MEENKKYQIIYADLPWLYSFSKSDSRKIENQYETMTLDDIKNIKIPAEDNSVLYLWVTVPKLLEGIEVMKAWGFTYKSSAVWDKESMGMGYWFRSQHELLLVGTKGKFSPPEPTKRVRSVFRFKRAEHSKKPDEIRQLIDDTFPNFTKLEMFARKKYSGWDSWGLEVDSDIELENNIVNLSNILDTEKPKLIFITKNESPIDENLLKDLGPYEIKDKESVIQSIEKESSEPDDDWFDKL